MKKKNIAGLIAIVAIVAVVLYVGCTGVDDSIIPEKLRYLGAKGYEAEEWETVTYVKYGTEDNVNEVITYYQELSGWTSLYILDEDETRRDMRPIMCNAEDAATIVIKRGSEQCKIIYCGTESLYGAVYLGYNPPQR